MCCEGYEERGVVEERIFVCREAGDGEPGGEGEKGVIAPVAVLCRERRRGQNGAEVVPRGYELRRLLSFKSVFVS